MSINLRQIFLDRIRNELFFRLMQGPLKDWDVPVVRVIVEDALRASNQYINSYLYQNEVTLLNMDAHIKAIVENTLMPYLTTKRVQ
jgi:hypothetical protein